MRRPWQIWLVFLSGLAVAFAAMGWLSLKTLDLEQDREQSRVEAELEEDVRWALGNLDYSLVMPILAQESAWPHFAYQPYYASGKSTGKSAGKPSGKSTSDAISDPIPSPLLTPTNEFVLLNFEINPDGRFVSPQVPSEKMTDWAVKNGSSAEFICDEKQRLDELKLVCSRDDLLERLPKEQPIAVAMPFQNNSNFYFNSNNTYTGNTGVYSGNLTSNGGTLTNPNSPPNVSFYPSGNPANSGQSGVNPTLPNGNGTIIANGPASGQPTGQSAPAFGLNIGAISNSAPTPTSQQPTQQPAQTDVAQQFDNPLNADYQNVQQEANAGYPNAPPQQGQGGSANSQQGGNGRGDYGRDNRDQQSKNSLDLAYRSRAFNTGQNFAQLQQQRLMINNDKAAEIVAGTTNVRQGLGKALWLSSSLVFARRVTVDGKTLIQGCLLDWPKLHDWLTAEVRATLPEAELVPVTSPAEETRGRMLATLPVKLTVPAAVYAAATWFTPIRISLLVAWGCALLGGAAVAALLFGVVTLSERRGAFVSAVTHELRTPLTTFRMYAEMLSEGMVHDPAQQKHYLGTLRAEADRLTHLVGNVLAYARLERGKLSDRLKAVPVADLIDRCRDRLADRAKQAEQELVVDIDEATLARTVRADSAAVEQILFNLVDNAGKYAATATDRRLHLEAEQNGRYVLLRVRDHGPGVCAKEAKRLFQPFRKSAKDAANSAPGVGLGLALCRRLARDLGGELTCEDLHGGGACFVLKLATAT